MWQLQADLSCYRGMMRDKKDGDYCYFKRKRKKSVAPDFERPTWNLGNTAPVQEAYLL